MTDLDGVGSYRLGGVALNSPGRAKGGDAQGLGTLRNSALVQRQSGLPLTMVDGVPILAPRSASYAAQLRAKRAMDIVLAVMGLIALAPLFIACTLMIRVTNPGPIFFRQQREGLNGALFEVLKFRSLYVASADASGLAQVVTGDPRVFALGRFMRRLSIDELPQLINVLRGEMSLVGPRPHVPGMMAGGMAYRDLVPHYDLRLQMLPGITGWAQANGLRGPTASGPSARARIDHDLAYIANFSVWLDLRIMLKTIRQEWLSGSGY